MNIVCLGKLTSQELYFVWKTFGQNVSRIFVENGNFPSVNFVRIVNFPSNDIQIFEIAETYSNRNIALNFGNPKMSQIAKSRNWFVSDVYKQTKLM